VARHTLPMSVEQVFGLAGRVALVTGAGSPTGIGFAAARLLHSLGASVVVGATTARVHDRAAALDPSGSRAAGVVADLTTDAGAQAAVAAAVEVFGGLDVLVANAGMTSVADPAMHEGTVTAISPEAWSASLARNLDTAFLTLRAALPALRRSGAGRVVTVASVTGPVMAMRGEAAYAAAKAGLVGLTRSVALDEAAAGITANVVAPGWIETGSQLPHEAAEGRHTPLGRSGTAEEVAAVIAFLAGPAAAYLTGQVIVVDGGNAIAEERLPTARE